MKMWVVFSVGERLRHIGHLDLMRAMQRALRRSGLEVCYSQGFSPHILLSLASPLSVGMAGDREVMEVPMAGPIPPETFTQRLNDALPRDIRVISCHPRPDDEQAAMAQVFAAQYVFEFMDDAQQLLAALPEYLHRESIPAVRRGKKGDVAFDLRPLVYNLFAREGKMYATLALSQEGTAKPQILLDTLADFAGIPAPRAIMKRTGLLTRTFGPLEGK